MYQPACDWDEFTHANLDAREPKRFEKTERPVRKHDFKAIYAYANYPWGKSFTVVDVYMYANTWLGISEVFWLFWCQFAIFDNCI